MNIKIMMGGKDGRIGLNVNYWHHKKRKIIGSVDDRKTVQMDEKYLVKIKRLMEERIKQETIDLKIDEQK